MARDLIVMWAFGFICGVLVAVYVRWSRRLWRRE